MKTKTILFSVSFLFVLAVHVQAQKDKQFLINYFQQTNDDLVRSIKGLDKNQLAFKASPESWSVSQCIEHIILTEKSLFEEAKKMLEKPAAPEKMTQVKGTDEEIIKGMTDRSSKFQAPEFLQPKGAYDNADKAINAFTEQRQQVVEYLKAVPEEDLRNHISQSPSGDFIDAYQFMIYIAGHSARHTDQIKEVKAAPDFP
jgi:hypothetical protein